MKYKVGDKVKIREDLEEGIYYNGASFVPSMVRYKGNTATITHIINNQYRIDIDDGYWHWSNEMFEENYDTKKDNMPMTVADLLNHTDVEKGGLIITICYPNAYFDATIGHNKIDRNAELYKRFIKAYGDMIVDEVSFDIRNDCMVVMIIKVDEGE